MSPAFFKFYFVWRPFQTKIDQHLSQLNLPKSFRFWHKLYCATARKTCRKSILIITHESQNFTFIPSAIRFFFFSLDSVRTGIVSSSSVAENPSAIVINYRLCFNALGNRKFARAVPFVRNPTILLVFFSWCSSARLL